jgi:dTDP-4-amino-4,6-dideoxygalactose transaminase
MGVEHKKLQRELEAFLDCPHVVLYTNGHLALENVIAAMEFPAGSEVITTPFTFASTTHAIVRNGLTPVFCDVNPDDYTMDVEKIEGLITEKTVAIVPVHVYGNMCDVERMSVHYECNLGRNGPRLRAAGGRTVWSSVRALAAEDEYEANKLLNKAHTRRIL